MPRLLADMSPIRNIVPFFLVLLVVGCASGPPQIKKGEAIGQVSNPKAPFSVAIHAEQESLHIGEPVRLSLHTASDGYINLYFIDSSDHSGQLLTNYPVRANEAVAFPPPSGKKLSYIPAGSAGVETFILVTTHRPINLFSGRDFKNRSRPRTPIAEFTLAGPEFLKRLRGAMRQWPPSAWNAASIRLSVLQ